MTNALFPTVETGDYLLDIKYQGASFNGVMEIDALGRELLGLEACLQRTIEILKKHKKIDFTLNDVDIFVEAFEKGSFRKKVKLVFKKGIRGIEKHPATSNVVAVLFVGAMTVIATLKAGEMKEPSAATLEKIKDQVKLELVQDKTFVSGLSEFVRPIQAEDDKLVIKDSVEKETVVDYEQKTKIVEATGTEEQVEQENEKFETLKGHVTRVDLDADVNHIGFKVDNKGSLVLCNLPENITREQMKEYLDSWINVSGLVTYYGAERKHMKVETIEVIPKPEQTKIDFTKK